MAGRRDRFEGETRPVEALAVAKRKVGRVSAVMRGVEAAQAVALGNEGRRADDARARLLAEAVGQRRMVAMGVGDEDGFDPLSLGGRQNRPKMRFVVRPRIY